jgi:hypothetical protein
MNDPFLFLKKHFFVISFCCLTTVAFAQTVQITVNAAVNKRKISPNIYGKNDFLDHSVTNFIKMQACVLPV